tara:strand:+ start:692 stop:898 length:207 start_codon:yes stop_codon:yes gene_type:complete
MSKMTWRSLLETMLLADCDTCELDDTVEVYDAESGNYYPADLIEFPSDTELNGNMFISINATPYQQTT